MQRDATRPDHPPNNFLPIDRDDFYDSQVADRPPRDHKASKTVLEFRMERNATKHNAILYEGLHLFVRL